VTFNQKVLLAHVAIAAGFVVGIPLAVALETATNGAIWARAVEPMFFFGPVTYVLNAATGHRVRDWVFWSGATAALLVGFQYLAAYSSRTTAYAVLIPIVVLANVAGYGRSRRLMEQGENVSRAHG
jgi:hypothetical protein